MNAIDMHTHAFPDALAARAAARLEGPAAPRMVAPPTTASLLASMDAAGIDASVVCTVATRGEQAGGILQWCEQIRSPRIVPFPSVHPDTPEAPRWIERIASGGFRGVKLHAMHQQFVIDEPRMDGIYAACRDCGLIVTFHCGCDFSAGDDDDRAAPQRVARVLERFAGLRVVASHTGGWRMWDLVERHLLGRDVLFELSYTLAFLPPQRAAELFRRHGAGRVMFGSDWPWADPADDLRRLASLPLTAEEKEAIRWRNAAALLRM